MVEITKQYAAAFSATAAGCPVACFSYIHFFSPISSYFCVLQSELPGPTYCPNYRRIPNASAGSVRQHTRTIPLTSELWKKREIKI